MKVDKKLLHQISWVLIIIGGLNWGLYGLFQMDLVNRLFGFYPPIDQVIYILVGLSALYELIAHKDLCMACGKGN